MRDDVTVADVEAVLAQLFVTHPPPWKKNGDGTESSDGAVVHNRWLPPSVQAALWGLHDLWFSPAPEPGERLRPPERRWKVGDRVRYKDRATAPVEGFMEVTQVYDDGSVECSWDVYRVRVSPGLLTGPIPADRGTSMDIVGTVNLLIKVGAIRKAVDARYKRLAAMAATVQQIEAELATLLDPTALEVPGLPIAWAVDGKPCLYAASAKHGWRPWTEASRAEKVNAYVRLADFLDGAAALCEEANEDK